ncbi:tetratricopeptide repeat protein [Aureivirga sp. CE67]|uniref:tetratricopeptide repeat protein n=1 Tax=Aureivirga sp. CE67 TaxID=1788983 RepID=UPI0018C9082C|nr:hypothetical protein [Aureivirga sp. CE67]
MKKRNTHIAIWIGIFCIPFFINAQKNQEEENYLKFQEHFFEALKLKANNEVEKSILEFENCYTLDTSNTAVHFQLAENYLKQKKYFEADLFINKALKQETDNYWFQELAATIFEEQHKYEDAIVLVKKMVEKKPYKSNDLIMLYIKNREMEKARDLIKDLDEKGLLASKYNYYKESARRNADKNKNKGNSDKNSIKSLINEFNSTQKFEVLRQLLILVEKENDFQKLLKYSEVGIELYPTQAFLYLQNAKALNQLKKYSDAVDILEMGMEYVFENKKMQKQFYKQFVMSYEGLNKKDKAKEYQKKL